MDLSERYRCSVSFLAFIRFRMEISIRGDFQYEVNFRKSLFQLMALWLNKLSVIFGGVYWGMCKWVYY